MARNSSGIYELPNPPAVPNTVISATNWNSTLNDIANALTESLPVDGSRGMVGSFKLSDGTSSNPAFSFSSESASGLFKPSTNVIALSIAGSERLRVHNDSVIIGSTTNSGEKLQVNGTSKFTGNSSFTNISTTDLTVSGSVSFPSGFDAGTGISSAGILFLSGDLLAVGNVIGSKVSATVGGSEASPSYTFGSDLDTGIFNPADGVIGISTNGIYRVKIDSIGINVTGAGVLSIGKNRSSAGDSTLEFYSSTSGTYDSRIKRSSSGIFTIENANGSVELKTNTPISYVTSTNSYHILRTNAATTNADFGTVDERLSSDGTISTVVRNAAGAATNTLFQISRNASGGAGAFYFNTGADVNVTNSGSTRLTINDTGVTVAGTVLSAIGTEALPTYSFASDSDTGMWRSSANTIDFSTGGVKRLTIDSAGRLTSYSTSGGDLLNLTTSSATATLNISTVSGTANVNNSSIYQNSTGQVSIILRNDAKNFFTTPIAITRDATTAAAKEIVFKLGGNLGTSTADSEVFRITTSSATSAVPIAAPKSVNASLVLDQIYSSAAGFTVNTGLSTGVYFVYNNSASSITVTQGSGLTLRLAGTATTGNRTIAQRGFARLVVISSTEYLLEGAGVS